MKSFRMLTGQFIRGDNGAGKGLECENIIL
jgi:hypothetical protein